MSEYKLLQERRAITRGKIEMYKRDIRTMKERVKILEDILELTREELENINNMLGLKK